MKATIKTFPCNEGDCIFMKLEDTDAHTSYHIMVDCGGLTSDIVDYIVNTFNERIDLLVATHIDSDHIDGITAMLFDSRLKDLQIDKIIYNCYQNVSNGARMATPTDIVEKMDMISNIVGDDSDTHISVKTSVSLGVAIAKNDHLKNVWNKEPITEDTEPLNLGDKWGVIKFLAPTQSALDDLYSTFRKEYASVTGCRIPESPYEDWECMIELLVKLDSLRNRRFYGKKISSLLLDEGGFLDARKAETNDSSLTTANKASIAFVWECNGHRVLFLGDARCPIVAKNIQRLYGEEKQVFDAVKIAHHGSKFNTNTDFSEKVDAHTYFLTGGSETIGHDMECLSKLLFRMEHDKFHRQLRYNVETHTIQELKSDQIKELRDKYNFEIVSDINTPAYEFEY